MKLPIRDRKGRRLLFGEVIQKVIIRFYNYYLDFKVALLWCLGYVPSHIFRKFIFRLSGVKIGRKSVVHIGCRFYQPNNVIIGDGTVVGDNVTLDGRDKLIIGDNVDIASSVMIFNSQHDIDNDWFDPLLKRVVIEDYVFIGPRAIILPGVKIGKGAIVGAGAVVTKDVEKLTVVGGVPAREIRKRKVDKLNYKLGRARLFQ